MGIICNNELIVRCSSCANALKFSGNDLDWDLVESAQREMGSENCYSANLSQECKCGNAVSVTIEVWEYPLGTLNDTNIATNNGEVINENEIDVKIMS